MDNNDLNIGRSDKQEFTDVNQSLNSTDFTAKRYELGDEDGFRLYFSYSKYDEELTHEPFMTFKNMTDLNTWKNGMINNQKGNNCILFEEPVPVIETVEGVEDVMDYHYIIKNSKDEVCLIHERVFSMFKYNHELDEVETLNGTIILTRLDA